MAITKVDLETKMILKVVTGVTTAGKPAYAQHSLTHFNPGLTEADFFDIGEAIGGLQSREVAAIGRQDKANLVKSE